MGVIVEEQELSGSVPATRFFKAFISKDLHLKVLPAVFKSCEFVEGNGGPGSIKLISYLVEGEMKNMKYRVDEVDETNRVYKFTIIEGGNIGQYVESVKSVNKVEDGPDGGCIFKITTTYYTKGDDHNRIQEMIDKAKHRHGDGFFHAAQGYLNSNPHEYN